MKWIVIILAGVVLAVGGWTANRAAVSVTNEEFQIHCAQNREDFQRIQETIDHKIDKIYEYIIGGE